MIKIIGDRYQGIPAEGSGAERCGTAYEKSAEIHFYSSQNRVLYRVSKIRHFRDFAPYHGEGKRLEADNFLTEEEHHLQEPDQCPGPDDEPCPHP